MLMAVPMMQIRIMRMPVQHHGMPMRMTMRHAGGIVRRMTVPMVLIMHMPMRMFHC